MSEIVADHLPDDLLERLVADEAAVGATHAVLIATIDAAGRAHPALLSYGQIVATGPATLRLAAHERSRTSANLRRGGPVTLCLVDPEAVHYVKARAREMPGPPLGHPGLARFEAEVEEVLIDRPDPEREAGATVVSGIRFRVPDEERWRREARALRRALREDA